MKIQFAPMRPWRHCIFGRLFDTRRWRKSRFGSELDQTDQCDKYNRIIRRVYSPDGHGLAEFWSIYLHHPTLWWYDHDSPNKETPHHSTRHIQSTWHVLLAFLESGDQDVNNIWWRVRFVLVHLPVIEKWIWFKNSYQKRMIVSPPPPATMY